MYRAIKGLKDILYRFLQTYEIKVIPAELKSLQDLQKHYQRLIGEEEGEGMQEEDVIDLGPKDYEVLR